MKEEPLTLLKHGLHLLHAVSGENELKVEVLRAHRRVDRFLVSGENELKVN